MHICLEVEMHVFLTVYTGLQARRLIIRYNMYAVCASKKTRRFLNYPACQERCTLMERAPSIKRCKGHSHRDHAKKKKTHKTFTRQMLAVTKYPAAFAAADMSTTSSKHFELKTFHSDLTSSLPRVAWPRSKKHIMQRLSRKRKTPVAAKWLT